MTDGETLFLISETVVDRAVMSAEFSCDVQQCKGACCTLEGGRGAPLENDEVLEIVKAYPIVKRYLDEKNIRTIEANGLYDGSPGDFATMCIEQRDCVFVYRDEGIAKCSFEKAFLAGEIDWQKPISCHLFPIRVRNTGQQVMRYEVIDECTAGRTKGTAEQISLHEFLKSPLIRRFGEPWYKKFREHCEALTIHEKHKVNQSS